MRYVQVLVPDDRRETVLSVFDDEAIDYVLTRVEDGSVDASVAQFPLPTEAVEYVMGALRDAGLEDEYVVIVSAETARTDNLAELEERFVDGNEDDESIATEEIRAKARDLTPNALTYYSMTFLSAVVATAGLLLDSPAVVVGSMVIAPQVGSALTASVGLVLDDPDMAIDGVRSQVYGLGLAVVGAAVFGATLRIAGFVPPALDVTTVSQISQRISPGLLTLAVGVAAGAAGAFGLATALPVSLVGVMIAAAIIPAAAAVGIGIAWSLPAVALGALVLLVVNTVSINIAGTAVLRYFGYSDDADGAGRFRRLPRRRGTVLVVVVLVVVAGVAGTALARQIAFENAANRAVEDVLSEPRYDGVELVEVETEFDDAGLFGRTETVTVTVMRPTDRPLPDLARAIGERLSRQIDRPIDVEVEFVEQQRYDAS